ncbi:hypothetical protein JHK82_024126 [Glycine max]|nr:hypothetical protein JHK86_024213 [Glycine max]KAG5132938.1 hypothetical protein JHK82_024126 [Glycine max]
MEICLTYFPSLIEFAHLFASWNSNHFCLGTYSNYMRRSLESHMRGRKPNIARG